MWYSITSQQATPIAPPKATPTCCTSVYRCHACLDFRRVLPICRKSGHVSATLTNELQHMLLWMVGRRIGSAIIRSRKTKIVCVRVYFWRRFSPFLGNSRTDNHTLIYVIPASSFFRSSSENTDCNMTVHFTPLKCENSVGTWAMRMQSNNLALRDLHVCNIGCGILVTYNSFFGQLRSWKRAQIVVLPFLCLLQVRTDCTLGIFCQPRDFVELNTKCWPPILLYVCAKEGGNLEERWQHAAKIIFSH